MLVDVICLAEIRLARGDAAEAQVLAAQAAATLERAYGTGHEAVVSTLRLQARSLHALGRAADATALLQRLEGADRPAIDALPSSPA